MEKVEITSISSRGQVVIPQGVRDKLNLHEGEKFVVIGEAGTIILKKLEMPSFKGVDKLLERTREFVKTKNIKPKEVNEAVKRVRSRWLKLL